MKTIVVISTRGFGVFRHDLVVEPDKVRFVGIFSEPDAANLTADQRRYFHEVHVVPCGLPGASTTESSIVDVNAARAIVRRIVGDTGPEHVTLHCFDERNMLPTAQFRAEFGLEGPRYDDILPFRDKCVMKEKLAAAGVRVPTFGRFDPGAFSADAGAYFRRISAEVGLPFILKPTSAASADGVYKIASPDDFTALPGDLGRAYEYEEYIEGTMYSVNIVSKGKKTVFGGITEYLVNSFDVQAGRVNADINIIDSDPQVARMVGFGEQVLAALGWLDGASHLELFRTKADELVFLEVGARFKGLAGLAAMQRNYGVALLNLAFEIEAGLKSRPWDQPRIFCFDGVIPKRSGVVERLVPPDIESEYSMAWKVKPGDVIGQGTSLIDNGGTFLVWNEDYDVLYRDFRRLASYRPIIYK